MFRRKGAAPAEALRARYLLRERLLTIGEDSFIENAQGQRAFYVDATALRLRHRITIRDMRGEELCAIQERGGEPRDAYDLRYRGGLDIRIEKAMLGPIHLRDSTGGEARGDLSLRGSIPDQEYAIERSGRRVAEVSKRWSGPPGTYSVEIEPGEDEALILASAAALDVLSR